MAYAHLAFIAALPKPCEAAAAANVRNARWPSPDRRGDVIDEHLHLTLLPVQQTLRARDLAPVVRAVVDRLAGFEAGQAFDLLLERAESLGMPGLEGRAPLALAVGRGKGAVMAMRRRLRATLNDQMRDCAFAAWKGADPHVTLSWRLDRIERTVLETPISWTVDEIALIHSHRGDSRYDIVERWPLTPFLLH